MDDYTLFSMIPSVWNDHIIGGIERQLDQRENNLHLATAMGMVEGGKRLTGMFNEIKEKRYEIRGQKEEYLKEKERLKQERKRQREAFKRGSARFFEQLGG